MLFFDEYSLVNRDLYIYIFFPHSEISTAYRRLTLRNDWNWKFEASQDTLLPAIYYLACFSMPSSIIITVGP